MLILKKIAMTGGISSGKTTVLNFFESFGAKVVSADAIVHDLLSLNSTVKNSIKDQFGDEVFIKGEVDRAKLANVVFFHPKKLDFLEKLLHPKVNEKIHANYIDAVSGDFSLFIAEIPLLFEIGDEEKYDAVILIDTPIKDSLKRFCSKGGSEKQFHARLQRQMPLDEKRAKADYIITNAGHLAETKVQARKIYQNFA